LSIAAALLAGIDDRFVILLINLYNCCMKTILFVSGLLLLIATEILKVYFIMPFPHMQMVHTLGFSYFINMHLWWFRIAGFAIIVYPAAEFLRNSNRLKKGLLVGVLVMYAVVAYLCNFKFTANRIFYEVKQIGFTNASEGMKDYNKLVIGVVNNGEVKAYPVYIVAYHHQLKDIVGGMPVLITYCSICRTGRVYSPLINGKYDSFKLVGINNSNAIFEDEATKSWWQQASGKAITGELKDAQLNEVPSQVMFMSQWLQIHPNSRVMKPDNNYLQQYSDFSTGNFKIFSP